MDLETALDYSCENQKKLIASNETIVGVQFKGNKLLFFQLTYIDDDGPWYSINYSGGTPGSYEGEADEYGSNSPFEVTTTLRKAFPFIDELNFFKTRNADFYEATADHILYQIFENLPPFDKFVPDRISEYFRLYKEAVANINARSPSTDRSNLELLFITSVPQDQKLVCLHEGCGRPIYRKIHVLRSNSDILVLGSDCFKKAYKNKLPNNCTAPRYAKVVNHSLTDVERLQLIQNTEKFISSLENKLQEVNSQSSLLEKKSYSELTQRNIKLVETPSMGEAQPISIAEDLTYKLIRRDINSYDNYQAPKVLPVDNLDIPAADLINLSAKEIKALSISAISYIFTHERHESPGVYGRHKLLTREVDRLFQNIMANKSRIR